MNQLVQQTEENKTPAQENKQSREVRASDVLLHLVTFHLMDEEFGIPILDVREIIRMPEITPVPQAPNFVEGVINLRGQILPVVDLRKRFGLAPSDQSDSTRVIVVEIGSSALGLIVDAVNEVTRIPEDTVSPPPQLVANSIGSEYLKGIAHYESRMIILIDIQRVFQKDELESLSGF